jgi:hypothetical protein
MNINEYLNTDIGINAKELYNTVSKYENSIFVDLGVRTGVSSEIMLIDSFKKNNKVYGVDVDFSMLKEGLNTHPNYQKILGDSSTVGKKWDKKINGLFIDTFHIKEQVLTELYFWFSHLEENSFIAFHDTNWPENKFDVYGGITWDRVEEGIKDFFKIPQLDYEDDFIKVTNFPESWGMTIVNLKQKKNYISLFENWVEVLNKRNKLISLFWNEENSKHLDLELLLDV